MHRDSPFAEDYSPFASGQILYDTSTYCPENDVNGVNPGQLIKYNK